MNYLPIRLLFILVMLGGLWGFSTSAPAEAPERTRVRLQLKWYNQFQFAGFYAAKKLGYFDQSHIDVEIIEGSANRVPRDVVAAGEAEFGVDAGASVLRDRMLGSPFVALGVIFQNSPLVVMTLPQRGIATPHDLQNRTIMLTPGAAEDAALYAMILGQDPKTGKPLNNMKIVPHSWNLSDLVEGRIDAIAAYATNEPLALRQLGFEPIVFDPVDFGINFYGDTLFTTEAFAAKHPQLIEDFRRACFHGWEYAVSHPEEVIDDILALPTSSLWKNSREMLLQEAKATNKYIVPRLVQTGQMNPARWQQMAKILQAFNLAPATADWRGIDYKGFLEQQNRQRRLISIVWITGGIGLVMAAILLWVRQLRILIRRRTQALAQSELRNRALLSALPDMVVVNKRNGIFVEFHGTPETYLPPDQFIGKAIQDVLPPPISDHLATLIQNAVSTGDLQLLEYPMDLRGTRRHFEARSVRCGEEEALTVVREVTSRKETESHLLRLAAALEQAADGIAITDAKRKLQYTNHAYKDIREPLPIPPGERLLKILPSDSSLDEEQVWESATDQPWCGRLRFLRSQTQTSIQDCSLAAIRDETNTVAGFVATFRDVTLQVELEEHLASAARMEAIGTLAGGIAHDFNNILSALSGYTELALGQTKDGSELHSTLRNIASGTERATQLVKQILTFSRQNEAERSIGSIRPAVEDAIRFLRATIPASIQITQTITSDAPVLVNPTEILRVIVNLGTNAANAMPLKTGRIDVVVETICNQQESDWVRIIVRDNGTGIPSDVQKRIFEPFFTTRRSSGGTGMGLAVVHGIIKDLGGSITFECNEGQGTSFAILLPVAESSQTTATTLTQSPASGNERILLVDDESMILDSQTTYLAELLQYKVTACRCPTEAFAIFSANPTEFDIVITDMTMPKINGLELAELIRSLHATIPVILCTGYSDLITDERLQKIGRIDFVMKPLAGKRLAAIIRKILDQYQN